MKFKLTASSIWEPGQRVDDQGRPHQEDSMFPASGNLSPDDRLFILCDGMGGHDAGEVASSTVCEVMAHTILSNDPDTEGPFSDQLFYAALEAAYQALDAKDTGAEKKMGTTMTFLKLHSEGATVAHMGDSRVYHIRPGKDGESTKILFMTEDHSLVNDLVRIGEMTHEEARHSNRKNVITRAMQPGDDRRCRADIAHITDIRPGDYFYLCSDGMLEDDDMESGRVLCNIFSDAVPTDAEKVRMLIRATQENKDNHTAILVRITDVEGACPIAPEVPTDARTANAEVPMSAANASSTKSHINPKPKKKKNGFVAMIVCALLALAGALYAAYTVFFDKSTEGELTEEVDDENYESSNAAIHGLLGTNKQGGDDADSDVSAQNNGRAGGQTAAEPRRQPVPKQTNGTAETTATDASAKDTVTVNPQDVKVNFSEDNAITNPPRPDNYVSDGK